MKKNVMLTREAILTATDLPFTEVHVPEWGGIVRVQTMTGAAREKWEVAVFGTDGKTRTTDNFRGKLIASTVVGEDGELLFTMEDAPALSKKSSKALDRVFDVAQELNGLKPNAVEKAAGNS